MKILIINYSRVGDSILSTALINNLLEEYPESQISIVTSSISKDLFENINNQTVFFDMKNVL